MHKTLHNFSTGSQLIVRGFKPTLAPELREHLSAWGLALGTPITLLAKRPVIRISVEYVELALESVVAESILVEEASSD